MANHVENLVRIRNCNQAVIDELQRIFSVKDEIGDTHTIDLINGVYDMDWKDEDYDRSWVEDNVGAKWVYGQIEGEWDTEITINLTSAWSPVNDLLEQLCSKLICIKEDVVVENTFEDESCDPMGVAYYSKEYSDEEYLDEEVDAYKFWDEDDYRESIYETLRLMMEDERRIHKEVIEELNEEREQNNE